jgi:hypothetical protein
MTLNFSGRHYPSDIIMQALRYYLAYKLSYREIEEMFAERNIHFDNSNLNPESLGYQVCAANPSHIQEEKASSIWFLANGRNRHKS